MTTLPGGNTCATAVALPTTSGIVTGTMIPGNDHNPESLPGCYDPTEGEVVYTLDVPNGATLHAHMYAQDSDLDEVIWLSSTCPPTACLAWGDNRAAGVEEVTWTNDTGSDQLVRIFVDTYSGSDANGAYALEWEID